jgi:hypothetical protein
MGIENSEQTDIKFYPNPASDKIYVDRNTENEIEVSISDLLGQEVASLTTSKEKKTEIDISDLKEGIYFLRIRSGTQSITKRMIVCK